MFVNSDFTDLLRLLHDNSVRVIVDPRFVADVAGLIERRASLAVTRSDGELFVDVAGQSFRSTATEHRIGT